MPIVSITVSEAAAIISAVNTFMSITFSMAIVAVLLALVNNKTSTNGWAAIGAIIQQSPWPIILRTDASRSFNVQTSINIISKLALIGTFLTALTGIVTPLGLHDIVVDKTSKIQSMSYVKDSGPMGIGTTPRSKYIENRSCLGNRGCPGSPFLLPNGARNTSSSSLIPSNITSKFNSQYDQGPFNIQYRTYTIQVIGYYELKPYSVGTFQGMQSSMLNDELIAFEGAVVDTTSNPGIGLLQHSFPNNERESSWSREILWLEPQSVCVDTNMTIQYLWDVGFQTASANATVVVDKGGIANLPLEQPPPYNDNSTFIDLAYHAYVGAVWSNLVTMRGFNITKNNTYVGKTFQLHPPEAMSFSPFGQLSFAELNFIPSMASDNITTSAFDAPNYADDYCRGYNSTDVFDGSQRLIACTLMLGSPKRLGDTNSILSANTIFEQPIYSCATAIRATIQRVNFTTTQPINNNTGFTTLKLSRQNTNASIAWAVEKTGMNVSEVNPYWGPVDTQYVNDPDLFVEHGEFMYLPSGASDYARSGGYYDSFDSQGSSIPGQIFPALKNIWSNGESLDFAGQDDYKLNKLWQNLTATSQTASRVVNLIWTNLMANNAIGFGYLPTASVAPRAQSVDYNLIYAIPAFVTLALWFPIFVIALVLLASKRVTPQMLRNAFNQTSVGRTVVNMIIPTSDSMADTKSWAKNDGMRMIGIKLEKTKSGSSVAKFDDDPVDQPLHKVLQALIPNAESDIRNGNGNGSGHTISEEVDGKTLEKSDDLENSYSHH
ncbi:hypothetical protein VKS41_007862 [Umbelopsis sp. WA50703]